MNLVEQEEGLRQMTILDYRLEDILKKRRNRDASRHGEHPHADRKRDFKKEKEKREAKRKKEEEAKKQKLTDFPPIPDKTKKQEKKERRDERQRITQYDQAQSQHPVDPKLPEEQQQKIRDENAARLRKLEEDEKERKRFSLDNFNRWLGGKKDTDKKKKPKDTEEKIDTDETLGDLDEAFSDAFGDDKKDGDAKKSWESWLERKKDDDKKDSKSDKWDKRENPDDHEHDFKPYTVGDHRRDMMEDSGLNAEVKNPSKETENIDDKSLAYDERTIPKHRTSPKYQEEYDKKTGVIPQVTPSRVTGTGRETPYSALSEDARYSDGSEAMNISQRNARKWKSWLETRKDALDPKAMPYEQGHEKIEGGRDKKGKLKPSRTASYFLPLFGQGGKYESTDSLGGGQSHGEQSTNARTGYNYTHGQGKKGDKKRGFGQGGKHSKHTSDYSMLVSNDSKEITPKDPDKFRSGYQPLATQSKKPRHVHAQEYHHYPVDDPVKRGRGGLDSSGGEDQPQETKRIEYERKLPPKNPTPKTGKAPKIKSWEKWLVKRQGEKMSEGNQGNLSKSWYWGFPIDDPDEVLEKKRKRERAEAYQAYEKRQEARREKWRKEMKEIRPPTKERVKLTREEREEASRKRWTKDNDTEEVNKDHTSDDEYRKRREAKREKFRRMNEGDFSGDPDKMTPSPEQIENRRRKQEKEAAKEAYKKAKKLRKKTEKKEVKLTEGGKKVLEEAKRYASLNMYKSWLETRKAIKGACPWCKDQPKETQDLADDTVGRMLDNASQKGPEHLSNYVRSLAEYQLEHDKNPEHFHKKWLESWDRAGEKLHPGKKINDTDPKQDEALKDVSGAMGGTRGLGHDGGSKQSPGSSAQITEVQEEASEKGSILNDQVKQELVPMINRMENVSTKAAYENHEQDEGTDVKPNSQQINPARPKVDTFKAKHLYKKTLIVKYNNIYKPLNI